MSNSFIDGFKFIFEQLPTPSGTAVGGWSFMSSKIVDHLEISFKAIAIAVIIGVPIGVFLGHIHRFSFLAINVSNVGRALPSLAVLAILLPITGVSQTTVIIALIVLAAPPILTNSYVAVDGVDADTVDAAKGIGLKGWQVLLRVEMPLALPLMFAGIRTSTVFVIATATLSGYFGGGGLGDIISNQASYRLFGVVGASYVLIVLAVLAQIVFVAIEQALTPEALRRKRGIAGLFRPSRTEATRDDHQVDADPIEEDLLEQGSPVS